MAVRTVQFYVKEKRLFQDAETQAGQEWYIELLPYQVGADNQTFLRNGAGHMQFLVNGNVAAAVALDQVVTITFEA